MVMKTMVLVMVCLGLAGGRASADDLKALAKREVNAGLAAQNAGHYDTAIAHYKNAYEAVPHPELLFNLGQAYRLKGDPDTALGYYRRYLAVEPNGRVARDANRWVRELEKQIAQRASEPSAPVAPRTAPVAPTPAEPHDAEPSAPRSPLRTYAVITAASGGGLVIGGLVFGALARSKRNAADDLCGSDRSCDLETDRSRANRLLSQSRLRGNISTVAITIGAASLVTSGVLWWLDRKSARDSASRTAIAPIVAPDHVGVAVGASF